MSASARAKPIGARLKVRLEDRLQHQLQRRLYHPVGDGRDAQPAQLAAGFGNHPLPHRQPAENCATFNCARSRARNTSTPNLFLDVGAVLPSTPAVRAPLLLRTRSHATNKNAGSVTRLNRSSNRRSGSSHRPTVQLGLDLQYPTLGPIQGANHGAPVFTNGISRHSNLLLADLLASFAMWPAFPCSDYYEASAPPRAHRSAAEPVPAPGPAARQPGRPRMVPTFTHVRSARPAPSSTPAASPRLRRRHSPWPPRRFNNRRRESASSQNGSRALHPGPYPPDLSRYYAYGASTTGSLSLYPLALLAGPGPSGSTGASRHCRGCFPPSPALPGSGCSQLHQAAATARRRRSFTSPRTSAPRGALTRR